MAFDPIPVRTPTCLGGINVRFNIFPDPVPVTEWVTVETPVMVQDADETGPIFLDENGADTYDSVDGNGDAYSPKMVQATDPNGDPMVTSAPQEQAKLDENGDPVFSHATARILVDVLDQDGKTMEQVSGDVNELDDAEKVGLITQLMSFRSRKAIEMGVAASPAAV